MGHTLKQAFNCGLQQWLLWFRSDAHFCRLLCNNRLPFCFTLFTTPTFTGLMPAFSALNDENDDDDDDDFDSCLLYRKKMSSSKCKAEYDLNCSALHIPIDTSSYMCMGKSSSCSNANTIPLMPSLHNKRKNKKTLVYFHSLLAPSRNFYVEFYLNFKVFKQLIDKKPYFLNEALWGVWVKHGPILISFVVIHCGTNGYNDTLLSFQAFVVLCTSLNSFIDRHILQRGIYNMTMSCYSKEILKLISSH
ncbi:hypothetical protein FF38_14470 [Lucilia cuprina]|uniref:Uncharacterized protein n=1 Tax=Lucilia cuprina TaxID=7375 RepID=A0A0L0C160_LUCCU|nr:hypothetical protein FF38_14470 [Lucilia cuprina]